MPTLSAPSSTDHVLIQLRRIRELSTSLRHAEALAVAEALAAGAPQNRDVFYPIAANQRCLSQIPKRSKLCSA
jgi:hypothetical protein